jgi:glycosyltransferase involved in cell wall biosynthesis/2-polyprenyl-3-methyl-5-hydroxy-6-metoxy-1,4-benzoquinol methylase
MRIVINAVSAKMGGAVSYLTNLLQHLPPPESGYRFFVFLPADTAKLLPDVGGNIKLCALPSKDTDGWRRLWWEQVTLRRFLRRENIDVLFSSANFAMLRCPVRQILLVRNALYFSKIYQQMFLGKHGLRFRLGFGLRRWMILQCVRSADVVMTPTQVMLDDLRRFVGLDPRKALVNPYGVASVGSPLPRVESMTSAAPPPAQGIVRLIYVSLYSEHKNLSTLLKAMPLLNRNGKGTFVLKTTADPGWKEAARTATYRWDLALARQPDVAPWVEFLGPLQSEQVEELYRQGDVFVFPSLCESFGHPMVEAMVHGLPIVASDTSVNREICGGAAVYFSPQDPEDLAEKVKFLWDNTSLRNRVSQAGWRRAARCFRWESHVARALEAAQLLSVTSQRGPQAAQRAVLPTPQEDVASEKLGQCPLCGGKQNSAWPRWDLVQCDECALVFDRHVWRKGADLESEAEWFDGEYAGPSSPWVKIFEKFNNQRTYRRIAPFLRNGARLLEVGVGTGSFLEYAKTRRVNVTGCDLSRAVCEDVARRLHVPMLNCSVDGLPGDTKYDVVVMNHVLEHVGAPTALLEGLRSRMKEGGLVHIAAPNVACWEARLSGWGSYEPYHSIYFSPDTIRKTLERSGFAVLEVSTHETFSAWFLTALRTLLRTRMRRAERRHAARRWRSASWAEHAYRISMVLAGVVSFPLRRIQASLGYGDELVVLCRPTGPGASGKTTNARGAVALAKHVTATIRGA